MNGIYEEVLERLKGVRNLAELDALKAEYLGRKGKIKVLFDELKNLPIEERKERGRILNEIREKVERAFEEKREELLDVVEIFDPTIPGKPYFGVGVKHPIFIVAEKILDILESMGFDIQDAPEVEEELYNFEMLNIPKYHPARDMQQTLYLNKGKLLRTHTSPFQIRYMLKNKPPLKAATFGKVFRADDFDATHSPVFHQIEGLAVDRNIGIGDLKWVIEKIVEKLFGEGTKVKFTPSYFPFTEPSMEVHVFYKGRWLEMLGCGMIHPNVLRNVGIDPDEWTGYAFGIGVERFAMVKYGIEDIRMFYENDKRFLETFKGIL